MKTLDQLKCEIIANRLVETNGNVVKAAETLGVNRNTIINIIGVTNVQNIRNICRKAKKGLK